MLSVWKILQSQPWTLLQLRITMKPINYKAEYENLLAQFSIQTDALDLMVDEFHRIKSTLGAHLDETYPMTHALHKEVMGYCERAISGIKQRVPVIEQRDQAEARASKFEVALRDVLHWATTDTNVYPHKQRQEAFAKAQQLLNAAALKGEQ